ncbi:unnamed protein product [Dovyalis caffra]|uniref:Uncharacterized protein n=1 Tax=Dovyalis caffra TaxID=77055 RepID=A0AAV1RUA0_9ROSI|nr:unnamed protein product [Dovyalis caffra]
MPPVPVTSNASSTCYNRASMSMRGTSGIPLPCTTLASCRYAALNLKVKKLLKAFEARPPPLTPLQAALRDTLFSCKANRVYLEESEAIYHVSVCDDFVLRVKLLELHFKLIQYELSSVLVGEVMNRRMEEVESELGEEEVRRNGMEEVEISLVEEEMCSGMVEGEISLEEEEMSSRMEVVEKCSDMVEGETSLEEVEMSSGMEVVETS